MERVRFKIIIYLILLCFFVSVPFVISQLEYDLKIIKLSSGNQTAVIQTDGKRLTLIKTGDAIWGKKGKVTDITSDRVVIETTDPNGPETLIFKIENGNQQMTRITKKYDTKTVLYPLESKTLQLKPSR